MNKIFSYQIDGKTKFADPLPVERKLWEYLPDLDQWCARTKTQEELDKLSPEEREDAEAEANEADEKLVTAYRHAFGHPWVSECPKGVDPASVENVSSEDCLRVLAEFFVWLDAKKKNGGSAVPSVPSTAPAS